MDKKAAFAGGVAVITGAGSGIGEGLSRNAAALGMKVVLADIVGARIEALAAELRSKGAEVLPVVTDVSEPSELDKLAEIAQKTFGAVRLLINNAGIETLGYSWEIPTATWEKILKVNIHGVIHGVRAFAPGMIAGGQPAYIANVASVGALGMMPLQNSYVLSKHAVLSFSESLALEMQLLEKQLKRPTVQVSAVLPGPVNTRIFTDAETVKDSMTARHQEMMHGMVAHTGITPLEAGERILDQIAAGQFWVSTHPEMTAGMAKARAEHLSGMTAPVLRQELIALIDGDKQ